MFIYIHINALFFTHTVKWLCIVAGALDHGVERVERHRGAYVTLRISEAQGVRERLCDFGMGLYFSLEQIQIMCHMQSRK